VYFIVDSDLVGVYEVGVSAGGAGRDHGDAIVLHLLLCGAGRWDDAFYLSVERW